jgi:hypothetical protein
MSNKENWRKKENLRFYGQKNLFFSTLPFNSSAIFATLLHVGAKYMKIELTIHFEQKFTMGSYRVGIGHSWCCQKACEICNSLV